MQNRQANVSVDGHMLSYGVSGACGYGPDLRLIDSDDNLIAGTPWAERGYTIETLLSADDQERLVQGAREIILRRMSEIMPIDPRRFSLQAYHRFIEDTPRHHQLISKTRDGFPLAEFPFPVERLEERISEICGVKLIARPGHVFYLRIIRPGVKNDNNPPHRDVWLPEFRNAVNIYAPIAGSNHLSSLPLIPGSHLWPECEIERTLEGAKVDGLQFQVPAAISTQREFKMIRPNPSSGEVMVFSPYLIHGGAVNLNADETRVSLEMRFWRDKS